MIINLLTSALKIANAHEAYKARKVAERNRRLARLSRHLQENAERMAAHAEY